MSFAVLQCTMKSVARKRRFIDGKCPVSPTHRLGSIKRLRGGPDEVFCLDCKNESVKRRRRATIRRAVEEAGDSCFMCGGVFPDECYDFHHIDPSQKEMSISRNSAVGYEKIRRELEKCVLLCANCHRIEHRAWSDGVSYVMHHKDR